MHRFLKLGKRSLLLFISFLLVAMPLHTFAYTSSIPDVRVIVTFKSNIDPNVVKIMKTYEGTIKRQGVELESVSATVPLNLIPLIQSYSSVKSVEYDQAVVIKAQTQDWGINKTNAPSAWNKGFTGKGVKVAVLDTGIANHEDLVISGGVSYVSYTTSYHDDQGHGTHVAGIIGAKNNSIGTVGIAPDSQIYAVKVLGSNGSGMMSDIIGGIDWAIANDMDVINMSLGSQGDSTALRDAVTRATNAGILVVVAAGNDGNTTGTGNTVDYPGQYENAITVGATDSNNNKASFSSAGPSVDVSAPGVSILSTLNSGNYGYMSGTSMATPYVAGMVALYKEAYPNYNASQIEQMLKNNTIDLGTAGRDNLFGVGLVQSPTNGSGETPTAPTAPLDFRATDVSFTTSSLAWNSVNGATMYELKRNGQIIYTGSNTAFNDSKLIQGTAYTYTLVAKNIGGTSPSATLTINTKSPALKTPTNLAVTTTNTTAKVSWAKVTYATSYVVKRNGVVVYNGPLNTFTDTGLVPGNSYIYEVIANNASGESIPASKTAYTKTNPVSNLNETHTSTTAQLTWNTVPGATYYQVKDIKTKRVIYKGPNTYINITNLLAGLTYSYEVSAGNLGGLSTPVSINLTTIPVAPVTPILSSIKTTQTTATLTWTKLYNAKVYELKRNGVTVYEGNLSTFSDVGLTPGVEYTYTLTAKNEIGNSPSLVVKKYTIPSTPTGLAQTSATTSTSLKWNPVPGATYYVVKRDNTVVYKGPATSFVVTGLLAGKTYKYSVSAGNTAGVSPVSTLVQAQTLQVAPVTPYFSKLYLTNSYVTLNWNAVYNATSYTVKKNGVVIYTGSLRSFKDVNVNRGTSYTYSISASNSAGSSGVKSITIRTPY